jgi:hypothetical protein
VEETIHIDEAILRRAGPDPLGVLASCAAVVNAMTMVRIDAQAVTSLAARLAAGEVSPPVWDDEIHYRGTGPFGTEQTAGWVFALDALNFCFWAQEPDPAWRWRIVANGQVWDGYMALAIALRDAARAGVPVWDPTWQANVDEGVIARIFAPASGSAPIPLLEARVANLRELGTAMGRLEPTEHPWTGLVARSGASAPALVQLVVETFPSFNDVAAWQPDPGVAPVEVRFHKRAQILASDLASALAGAIELTNVDQLTAFADYKVPQVLRAVGILRYRDDLAATIRRRELIPAGSVPEIEIRAATIWGCEVLRQALARHGRDFTAAEVDWLLWNQGQHLPGATEPYHRTRTVYY